MHNVDTYIYIRFQREGIHRYPEAGTNPQLADVSFLAFPHRHIFHFTVDIQVFDDDREIEFIQFKRWIESLYDEKLSLGNKSCEMIAKDLLQVVNAKYPGRNIEINVSEDDENGCIVSYFK